MAGVHGLKCSVGQVYSKCSLLFSSTPQKIPFFRLRELCVKLMFLHPVDYGRKAEELLWRKVYYEVIQLIKTNKKASYQYI